jgi:hypothetical protein
MDGKFGGNKAKMSAGRAINETVGKAAGGAADSLTVCLIADVAVNRAVGYTSVAPKLQNPVPDKIKKLPPAAAALPGTNVRKTARRKAAGQIQ